MISFDELIIRHPALKALLRYWRSLSRKGSVPRRRDIDPVALRKLLPHLYLIDAGATPDELRYRLAGSIIVQAFGFEPGRLSRAQIRACHVKPERYDEFNRTSAETHRIVTHRIVAYTHDHMTSYTKDYLAYARLNLPISEDGETPSGIFGAIYLSSDGDPFWNRFEELHVETPLDQVLAAPA
ncbi:PAS domain-containing protein [Dongia sp.]|uniref:PAS domain-containing protein n=1 Tax=Dongia sp. TaxID=1977262 RepID=UPI0035ADA717